MNSRLTEAERKQVATRIKAFLKTADNRTSYALYALKLSKHRQNGCGSNGRNVVAIIRNGRIHTVMLRRDNQPPTRAALRVDEVVKEA